MQRVGDPTRAEEPALEEALPLPTPGCEIDHRYRIVRSIASGGMGSVFEAELIPVGRRCAIKFLRTELAGRSRSAARFEREARLLGKLQHEHLTAVLDYGMYLGRSPFLVMEYLEGRTLKHLLNAEGSLALGRLLEILLQLARGMAYVHEQAIVHRDLKPENLMLLERSDGRLWLKILDFGIARVLEDATVSLTRSGTELGTAHYMSPEQARGARTITPASDVYAMGVIAYEALTGTRLHPGDSYNAVIFRLLTQPHQPLGEALPDCPAPVVAIIERCLEKEPERRYPDAGALVAAVAAFQFPEPRPHSGGSPGADIVLGQGGRKELQRRAASGAALLALGAATGALLAGGWHNRAERAPVSEAAFCRPAPTDPAKIAPAAPLATLRTEATPFAAPAAVVASPAPGQAHHPTAAPVLPTASVAKRLGARARYGDSFDGAGPAGNTAEPATAAPTDESLAFPTANPYGTD